MLLRHVVISWIHKFLTLQCLGTIVKLFSVLLQMIMIVEVATSVLGPTRNMVVVTTIQVVAPVTSLRLRWSPLHLRYRLVEEAIATLDVVETSWDVVVAVPIIEEVVVVEDGAAFEVVDGRVKLAAAFVVEEVAVAGIPSFAAAVVVEAIAVVAADSEEVVDVVVIRTM